MKPKIISTETNSFGDKIVKIVYPNGKIETLEASEGEHHLIDLQLKMKGVRK